LPEKIVSKIKSYPSKYQEKLILESKEIDEKYSNLFNRNYKTPSKLIFLLEELGVIFLYPRRVGKIIKHPLRV